MGVTAEQGPLVTFGDTYFADTNAEIGPNAWHKGDMILDPRQRYTYQPGQATNQPGMYGWPAFGSIPLIDASPVTASASNIASATPTTGVALALASSSVAGVTVGLTIQNSNGQQVSGLLGLDVSTARTVTGTFTNGSPKITFTGVVMQGVQINDRITLTTSGTLPAPFALLTTYYVNAIGNGAMMLSLTPDGPAISATTGGSGTQTINVTDPNTYYNGVQYNVGLPAQPPIIFGNGAGQGGAIRMWNPSWALSRCVGVTSNADDTGGTYTIKGFDIYGMPMTQTITGLSSGQAKTTKAFKYIQSVTPNGTINSTTLTVGALDLFGLPLRTDYASQLTFWFAGAAIIAGTTASSTFAAADITTPTALTGDVRGTVYSGTASNSTNRMTINWSPYAPNMRKNFSLVGQPQF